MLRFRTALKDLISLSGVLHSGPTLSARGVLSRAPDEWQWLRDRGVQLNPCNSPCVRGLHIMHFGEDKTSNALCLPVGSTLLS